MEKTIDTLIKSNKRKGEDRWYPIPVDCFRKGFTAMSSDVEGYHPLVDNLAYNLQYIQFLEKEMEELELSSVLYTMLVKTYVITGISIIEGIFSYVIKTNGWWQTKDEEVVGNTTHEQKNSDGDTYVIRVEVSKNISPYNDKMTFDQMLKKLKNHHKALSVDHLLYPQLARIRKLRNRVHLQIGEDEKDHDYNAFDYYTKVEMQRILYNILCSPKVTDPEALHNYDFLKPAAENQK